VRLFLETMLVDTWEGIKYFIYKLDDFHCFLQKTYHIIKSMLTKDEWFSLSLWIIFGLIVIYG
jgi:hypothetical protein